MVVRIMNFPRRIKQLIAICVDALSCLLATWISFYLRLGDVVEWKQVFEPAIISVCLAMPILVVQGLYSEIVRYCGWSVFRRLAAGMIAYGMIYGSALLALELDGTPRTIGLIQPLVLICLLASLRLAAIRCLSWFDKPRERRVESQNILIYGAGSAGRQAVTAISQSQVLRVVGFIDDNTKLHGHRVNGLKVYGISALGELIKDAGISMVLLAIPSITRKRRAEILGEVSNYQVDIKTLPSVAELLSGSVTLESVKELDIDDLLGRNVVSPNNELLTRKVTGRGVMVTGAGGSIGGELCKLLLQLRPRCIILVEMSEYALYSIHEALVSKLATFRSEKDINLVPVLCSASDGVKMREIIEKWSINTIYHAAAYKHVPMVEYNPTEGIRNNVFGTFVVAKAALDNGVDDCVLVSTDKAVRPTNVMGASKRLAEMVFQSLQGQNNSRTCFSIVRFGNVLASSGSVIPRFRKQILSGGPVTVTHSEVNRFFMTVSEAAQLVLQAAALARGGDVFLLDMGEPVKIVDLARRMIKLSGFTEKTPLNRDGDIEIVITGLRPGEKLYEELLIEGNPKKTLHPKIMAADESYIPWAELSSQISQLKLATDANDVEASLRILKKVVEGYSIQTAAMDWTRG